MKRRMFEESIGCDNLADDFQQRVETDYLHLYQQQFAQHFLATMDGKTVAVAGAFIKSDIPYCYFHNSQYGFIGDVYSEPEYRGQGIATQLNRNALQWLKEKNLSLVRLLATDVGRPIYEKMGFVAGHDMELVLARK